MSSSPKMVEVAVYEMDGFFSFPLLLFNLYNMLKCSLQRQISIAFDKTLNEKLNYSKKNQQRNPQRHAV